jgi:hypothetical protein
MFEWMKIRGPVLDGISWLLFAILMLTGLRAVFAVVA